MLKNSKFANLFFNEQYEIQHKLLNVIVISGIIGMILALIFQFVMHFNTTINYIVAVCLALCIFVLFLANIFKHPQLAAIILSIGVNNFFMPVCFLFSGGIESGMPLWIVLGIIFSSLVITGKKAILIFIINITGFISVLIFSFIHPEFVHPMATMKDEIIDIGSTVIIVSLIMCVVLIYNNYAHQKQKKQIFEAMQAAKKATQAKTDFLSHMSHDIRTPMNTIVGFTELAKKNIKNPVKLKDTLEKVSLSSTHLLNLLNEVLDMSKIESGKLSIAEENCSITEIIQNVCQIMQNECTVKNISLKTDLSMIDDDVISCDKLRVNQILINIINNAIKYSKPNGNVYISVIQFTSDDISKNVYEFHIRDEGCGMSKEFMENLYTPFERDKLAEQKGISGSGLGLTITKSIIDMMNGKIEVESEVDKGTEFTVTLAFSVPDVSEIEETESFVNYDFSKYNLLLVDDNDLHRELTIGNLREAGFNVDEAGEGNLAIEKLKIKKYDLVLMDIVMPVMDGYQATKMIRASTDERISKIPIIAMTANAYAEEKAKAFEAGMNAYVTKPIDYVELLKILTLILHEQKS